MHHKDPQKGHCIVTSALELFKNLMTFSILKRELIAIEAKHVTFWGYSVRECSHLHCGASGKAGESW